MAQHKLLFLYQNGNLPSSRIRVLNIMPELKRLGLDAKAMEYPRCTGAKLALVRELRGFDVVYLQKKLPSLPEACLLRSFSNRLIFDFDDAIYMRDDRSGSSYSKTRMNRFQYMVGKADMVVAGNPILAQFANRFNPRVEVLPSAVPVEGVPVKQPGRPNGRTVIGWIGGRGNLHHLAMIVEPLRRLAREIDLELRVVSDGEFRADGVSVGNIPWSLERQELEISQFDIGVMPLPKNEWTAGKCSYKLLQYMAAAVPVVATRWGFNSYVVREGETGYLAENPDDFYGLLKELAGNREKALEMGMRGRSLAEKEFSIGAIAGRVAAIIGSLPT